MSRVLRLAALAAVAIITVACGRDLQRRHEFETVELVTGDGTRISVYAHGYWTRVRTSDSSYSLRGSPFTLEIQVRGVAERVTGGTLTLRDSSGTPIVSVNAWRVVAPSGSAGYSLLVADSIALPYQRLHIVGSLMLTSDEGLARAVAIDTVMDYRFRISRPLRLLEVLGGV